ncbi:hypothetical protein RQP54_15925 [Curvibacter sp. APW13]|uniref:hypothetical protein n=1 Tax=Curvibacter sp. APW13 TaxID=3077236 RepID=UPI0028DEA921|nr:hypothetical protein [Curvibacter sp. APW13]MDT8992361.1 hypothetical protein [Curvibacter sp. APW13]
MKPFTASHAVLCAALACVPCVDAWAQTSAPTEQATKASFDRALNAKENWYFSWGWSRQQYAPSDIHVSQPELGRDFTVHQASATDFPTSFEDTIKSTLSLELTNPQENIRIGKFLNEDKTFAIELNIDHSKYNTDLNQTVEITGTAPQTGQVTLNSQNFYYALHNGLNHIMLNAVWFKHLRGPVQQPGDLQLVSRLGAGILLPHAENTIFGQENQVGPKNQNICCGKGDWWQINGWTAGVEVGLRYTVYKSIYLELTQKIAYGELRNVPVYKGTADQKIWMSEQVLSTGFLF